MLVLIASALLVANASCVAAGPIFSDELTPLPAVFVWNATLCQSCDYCHGLCLRNCSQEFFYNCEKDNPKDAYCECKLAPKPPDTIPGASDAGLIALIASIGVSAFFLLSYTTVTILFHSWRLGSYVWLCVHFLNAEGEKAAESNAPRTTSRGFILTQPTKTFSAYIFQFYSRYIKLSSVREDLSL